MIISFNEPYQYDGIILVFTRRKKIKHNYIYEAYQLVDSFFVDDYIIDNSYIDNNNLLYFMKKGYIKKMTEIEVLLQYEDVQKLINGVETSNYKSYPIMGDFPYYFY